MLTILYILFEPAVFIYVFFKICAENPFVFIKITQKVILKVLFNYWTFFISSYLGSFKISYTNLKCLLSTLGKPL